MKEGRVTFPRTRASQSQSTVITSYFFVIDFMKITRMNLNSLCISANMFSNQSYIKAIILFNIQMSPMHLDRVGYSS